MGRIFRKSVPRAGLPRQGLYAAYSPPGLPPRRLLPRRGRPWICKGFRRPAPHNTVTITLHGHADTESYPQLPQSFQQLNPTFFNPSQVNGIIWQICNRSSFPCESAGLLDITFLYGHGGEKRPCDAVTGPFRCSLARHTGAAPPSRLFPYVMASLEAQPPSTSGCGWGHWPASPGPGERAGRRLPRGTSFKRGERTKSKQKAAPTRVQQTNRCEATGLHPPNARGGHDVRHMWAGILAEASNVSSSLPRSNPVASLKDTSLTQQRHCAGFTPASLLCARSAPTYLSIHFSPYVIIIRARVPVVKRPLPVFSHFLKGPPAIRRAALQYSVLT